MAHQGDEEDEQLCRDILQRQQHPRGPQRIAEVLSRLMARSGYAQEQVAQEWQTVWGQVAGDAAAADSRVGRLRGGVLEIVVRNSSVLQELTFRKRELLKQLQQKVPKQTLREIRFPRRRSGLKQREVQVET